jgi:uncharacterized protein (DUF433 family)
MKNIIIDPDVCNGQPVYEGTRITVHTILEFLGAGDTVDEIVQEYPSLSPEDVIEAIRFSSLLMQHHFLIQEVA